MLNNHGDRKSAKDRGVPFPHKPFMADINGVYHHYVSVRPGMIFQVSPCEGIRQVVVHLGTLCRRLTRSYIEALARKVAFCAGHVGGE